MQTPINGSSPVLGEVTAFARSLLGLGDPATRLRPLGATGIGQLPELVAQLLGEAGVRQVQGARHAIQENGGGLQGIEEAAVAIHILGK
jgi:hypothetical protein